MADFKTTPDNGWVIKPDLTFTVNTVTRTDVKNDASMRNKSVWSGLNILLKLFASHKLVTS